MTIRFRFLDALILALSIGITIFFTWFFYAQGSGPARLEVNTEGGKFIYALDSDQILHFKGPVGDTEVHIKGGETWVETSDCSNKLCIAMGHISHAGDWIACLPNKIFLRISATDDGALDAKTF